jgi:hypothetical protein
MNTKLKVELLTNYYLECKPKSIMLVPEIIDLTNASPSLILQNLNTTAGIAKISGTSLELYPTKK